MFWRIRCGVIFAKISFRIIGKLLTDNLESMLIGTLLQLLLFLNGLQVLTNIARGLKCKNCWLLLEIAVTMDCNLFVFGSLNFWPTKV